MLIRSERQSAVRSPEPTTSPRAQLVELVSPRTNAANYTPTEHLFAALAREGAVSLEIGGDATARRFYARFAHDSTRGLLDAQLGAAYPQARVRQAAADPARLVTGEQVALCALALRKRSTYRCGFRETLRSPPTERLRRTRSLACWRRWAACPLAGEPCPNLSFSRRRLTGLAATCAARLSTL